METTWKRAHAELSRIAKARAALDHEEGRWLLVAWRQQVHARLGFGSFVEYAERLLGHSPRATLERLRAGSCSSASHHRAVHRGRLLIEGSASRGFSFRHADGSSYGEVASPPAADSRARAFRALTRLGYSEREARRALDSVRTHVGADDEALLRAALCRLSDRAIRVSDPRRPTWVSNSSPDATPTARRCRRSPNPRRAGRSRGNHRSARWPMNGCPPRTRSAP